MSNKVRWRITLSNGIKYIVLSEIRNSNEFMKYLFNGNGTSVISIHELEKPILDDDIKISSVAINSSQIVSVEW